MTLGLAERQGDLLDDVNRFCEATLAENSIFAVLHRERDRLFRDELFADLFSDRGRRSVPPSVVATVMVLQRLQGLSDREAVEAYTFDARWRYAAGVGGYDGDGWGRFAHTVLVDMRARLAASDRPKRIFEVTRRVAGEAGLVGVRRVLDSTPLYDAVATMDTLTLIRSAIRGLLKAVDADPGPELRSLLASADDYVSLAKPQIDWDDNDAREQLVHSRAADGYLLLDALDGRQLSEPVAEAAALLATVLGQDLDRDADGTLRVARRVAPDRVISTVDPDARHGHKTSARGFDGYKGHLAIDPDSEIITDTEVTAGNAGDAAVAADLIEDLTAGPAGQPAGERGGDQPTVYGDSAYGCGEFLDVLAQADIDSRCKNQPPPPLPDDRFTKEAFTIDLARDTVTCPAGVTAPIRRGSDGDGLARFGAACATCPLQTRCTRSASGRSVAVSRHERHLAAARHHQRQPTWIADYQATRPKVERKIGHLMRRRHGGRRARVRSQSKVDADFNLLAAAVNLARLAVLGLHTTPAGWAVTPAAS